MIKKDQMTPQDDMNQQIDEELEPPEEKPLEEEPETRTIHRKDPISGRFSRVEVNLADRLVGPSRFFDKSGKLRNGS